MKIVETFMIDRLEDFFLKFESKLFEIFSFSLSFASNSASQMNARFCYWLKWIHQCCPKLFSRQ